MAFFDVPSDAELSPETRQTLEEYRRITGKDAVPATWLAYGRNPKIIEARFKAYLNLSHEGRFSWAAMSVAVMLIAHAKRCRGCFTASRVSLEKLGYDEATLDGFCANPEALPLKERDRLFVHYALKIATGSADLTPKDFKEMAAHDFSKGEIQEIIAFSAYWVMNMVFTQSANAALAEE